MKSLRTRVISVVLIACLLIIGTLVSSAASASTSNTGAGGGIYAGDTIEASAWETSIAPFTVDTGQLIHPQDTDVYSYRIALPNGSVVDYQPIDGLEGLSKEQQEQWYVDAGWAPYDFTWVVFYCPVAQPKSVEPPAVIDRDPAITLVNAPYRSVDTVAGFPNFTSTTYNDWFYAVADGSAFLPDVTGGLDTQFRAAITSPFVDGANIDQGVSALLATSYLNFFCPDGDYPEIGRVLNSASPDDFAVDRSLDVGSTLFIQPLVQPGALPPTYEIPSSGTYIGVTGGGGILVNANVALWGVAYVNAGARELPATGIDVSAVAFWCAVSALTISAGVILVRHRRRERRA